MQFAFGFLLFVVGFAMLLGGVGLLIGGEITLKSGKKIPKLEGRKAGIALVSFFPVIGIALFILRTFDPDRIVDKEFITWPIALICLGLAAFWVYRGMNPRQAKQAFVLTPAPPAAEPQPEQAPTPVSFEFDVPGTSAPPSAPTPAATPRRKRSAESSPFDFS